VTRRTHGTCNAIFDKWHASPPVDQLTLFHGTGKCSQRWEITVGIGSGCVFTSCPVQHPGNSIRGAFSSRKPPRSSEATATAAAVSSTKSSTISVVWPSIRPRAHDGPTRPTNTMDLVEARGKGRVLAHKSAAVGAPASGAPTAADRGRHVVGKGRPA